jgi:hypothetical protein
MARFSYATLNKSLQRQIVSACNAFLSDIYTGYKKNRLIATGDTYNKFKVVVNSASTTVALPANWYYTEYGRKAGRVPRGMVGIIEDWMAARGIRGQSEKDTVRIARAIAWRIHKMGTRRSYTRQPAEVTEPAYERLVTTVYDAMPEWIRQRIVDTINFRTK